MQRFIHEHVALETLNIFSSRMSCQKPKNPAADVLNQKSEEERVDHLAGSIWYAK